jgi:hypothetical protein
MEYKTTKQIAVEWGMTPRRVQILCKENRIEGAIKMSGVWIIPINSTKPCNLKRGPRGVKGKRND